ncbi:MAG: lipase family protein [Defluviitaleaceae bacterium]|nr:lipase family protein [Defluviitaleaceae bacterium]
MKIFIRILYTITGIATLAITVLIIYTARGGFDTQEVTEYFVQRVRVPITSATTVTFDMDYRMFFGDNTIYSPDIAHASLLISHHPATPILLESMGLSNIEVIYPGRSIDNDRVRLTMGYRQIEYAENMWNIVNVYISGLFEHHGWFSMFDIGADIPEYFTMTGQHPDWINPNNHKGFDVTANRIIAEVKRYIDNIDTADRTVLWVTGHSRGGAVANIVGAYFENDPQIISFTYSFATPNITTDTSAREYQTIFNIINEDDMIPLWPPVQWGFIRYGRDISLSVADFVEEFSELIRLRYFYYENMDSIIRDFAALIPNREAMYDFEWGTYYVSWDFESREEVEEMKDRMETVLHPGVENFGMIQFVNFEIYEIPGGGYRLVNYQSPAFFVKVLAEIASGANVERRYIAPQFVNMRTDFNRAFNISFSRANTSAAHYVIVELLRED